MFAGGLSSMVGDGIKDDDTDANAGMILNFLGNQVSFLYVFAEFVQGNIQTVFRVFELFEDLKF